MNHKLDTYNYTCTTYVFSTRGEYLTLINTYNWILNLKHVPIFTLAYLRLKNNAQFLRTKSVVVNLALSVLLCVRNRVTAKKRGHISKVSWLESCSCVSARHPRPLSANSLAMFQRNCRIYTR